MARYDSRVATPEDIPVVARNMCVEDQKELYRSSGLTPYMALTAGWYNSAVCRVATVDDVPVLMYGVVPIKDLGIIWLAGENMLVHIKAFLKSFPEELQLLCKPYRVISNYMDTEQKVHRRLLERQGFTFDELDTYNSRGATFIRFTKEK